MTESSLSDGNLGGEPSTGLDATAGVEEADVTGFFLRLPAREVLCLIYSDINSADQLWHSGQRVSRVKQHYDVGYR